MVFSCSLETRVPNRTVLKCTQSYSHTIRGEKKLERRKESVYIYTKRRRERETRGEESDKVNLWEMNELK